MCRRRRRRRGYWGRWGDFVKRACKLLGLIGIRVGEDSSGQVSLEFRFIKAGPAVRLAYAVDEELISDLGERRSRSPEIGNEGSVVNR